MDYYHTIEKESVAEFKDRGSRFLAYAFPINDADEFKKKLQLLKKEHGKAVHHCFAYRLGYSGNNFRSNDDGEPSGSAGKPILGQIDSKNLTNIAIIVVRYFGGSLLGVPGLINAYKTASVLALQTVPMVQKPIMEQWEAHFEYNLLNDIMLLIKNCQCSIQKQDLGLFSTIIFEVPRNREEEAMFKMKDLRNATFKKLLP